MPKFGSEVSIKALNYDGEEIEIVADPASARSTNRGLMYISVGGSFAYLPEPSVEKLRDLCDSFLRDKRAEEIKRLTDEVEAKLRNPGVEDELRNRGWTIIE